MPFSVSEAFPSALICNQLFYILLVHGLSWVNFVAGLHQLCTDLKNTIQIGV